MYPNFGVQIAIRPNHLLTNLKIPIILCKLVKTFQNFNFLYLPLFRPCYIGLQVYFISIDMVDTFVILMIEQYTTDIRISLFHSLFE